jgi:hypothetical protein
MSDTNAGDSSRAPTVTELIQREIQTTGDWTKHPWWRSDPEFLKASGLTIEVVESAFAELRHTFDPAWALRRTKDGTAHWFLKTIAVPLRPTLEVLVELGLALGRIECANPGAATRLRRELRETGDRTGAYYEGVVGALLVGKDNIESRSSSRISYRSSSMASSHASHTSPIASMAVATSARPMSL